MLLKLLGSKHRYCDGISRRSFMHVGGLAMGGLSLPQLLAAEQASGIRSSHKAVIMVFLSGGPPHQDMVDLKMDAPAEIRGEFKPIATAVPGLQICEHLPKLAQRMDRLTTIRSLVGSEGRHAAFQCLTGWPITNQPKGGWPSFWRVRVEVARADRRRHAPECQLEHAHEREGWADVGQPGFVGQAHAPFTPNLSGQANMVLSGISPEEFSNRYRLMTRLDKFRRDADATGAVEGMDACHQQAFGILTSSRLADALDLGREDPALRARYGGGSNEPAGYGDAGPLTNDYLLAARRLVEAGVRVVSLAYGRWDWHGRPHGTNFDNARDHLPQLDNGLTVLLDDLEQRGMSNDVSVVVWGEFGRTPRINKNGGRDHWPNVACALLAGGGMRHGQVIGATNRLGEHPISRPVHFQEIFATLYKRLGIDVDRATINDMHGRPRYLVDSAYAPLREVT